MRSEGEDRREGVRRRPPTNKQGRRRTHDNPHLYMWERLPAANRNNLPSPPGREAGRGNKHHPLHRESRSLSPWERGGGEGTNITLSTVKAAPSPLAGEGWGEGERTLLPFLKGGPERDFKTPPQHETPSLFQREGRGGISRPPSREPNRHCGSGFQPRTKRERHDHQDRKEDHQVRRRKAGRQGK